MNWFQLVALPLVGLLFLNSVWKFVRGGRWRATGLFGALIWVMAAIAIYQPELTTRVASAFGIGRGADLLLYLVVIAFLLACFYLYHRLQQLESTITEIVRRGAIQEALQRWPTVETVLTADTDEKPEDSLTSASEAASRS